MMKFMGWYKRYMDRLTAAQLANGVTKEAERMVKEDEDRRMALRDYKERKLASFSVGELVSELMSQNRKTLRELQEANTRNIKLTEISYIHKGMCEALRDDDVDLAKEIMEKGENDAGV